MPEVSSMEVIALICFVVFVLGPVVLAARVDLRSKWPE